MGNIGESSLSELLRTKPKTTDYTKNGECIRCGACCPNRLTMTEDEVERIRRYVRKNNIKPNIRKGIPMVKPVIDVTCPFLDNKCQCMVYEVRPAICRLYKCNKTEGQVLMESLEAFEGKKIRQVMAAKEFW